MWWIVADDFFKRHVPVTGNIARVYFLYCPRRGIISPGMRTQALDVPYLLGWRGVPLEAGLIIGFL